MTKTWIRVLIACGGFGVTVGGVAVAETAPPTDGVVQTSAEYLLSPRPSQRPVEASATPTIETPAPTFAPGQSSPSVVMQSTVSSETQMELPTPAPAPVNIVIESPSQAADTTPATPPGTMPGAAEPQARPDVIPAAPSPVVPSAIAADESIPPGYNSVFIDPTDYSVGATENPNAPSLVFSERSTGCEMTIQAGQSVPAGACEASPAQQAAVASGGSGNGGGVQIGPVNIGSQGVTVGNTTVISREYFNEKIRPLNVLRQGIQQYIFPLSVPAPITSLFGWRIHPIFGEARFHSGTDLAAPTGTPVLATRSGRVSVSDYLGGYGLTVILRHDEGNLESRYAHLSQVAVRPGEWVEQGEVIGLVGSTGNSTGPHLHFELRQLTAEGWVAVDPREVLQYGVANLIEILDNPMQALAQSSEPTDAEAEAVPTVLPYRPAQPNAS